MWQLARKAAEAGFCWRKLFSFPNFNVDVFEVLLCPVVKHVVEVDKDSAQA